MEALCARSRSLVLLEPQTPAPALVRLAERLDEVSTAMTVVMTYGFVGALLPLSTWSALTGRAVAGLGSPDARWMLVVISPGKPWTGASSAAALACQQ